MALEEGSSTSQEAATGTYPKPAKSRPQSSHAVLYQC